MTWFRLAVNLYVAGCAALVTGVVFGLIFGPLMVSSRESEREYQDWRNREGKWARAAE